MQYFRYRDRKVILEEAYLFQNLKYAKQLSMWRLREPAPNRGDPGCEKLGAETDWPFEEEEENEAVAL